MATEMLYLDRRYDVHLGPVLEKKKGIKITGALSTTEESKIPSFRYCKSPNKSRQVFVLIVVISNCNEFQTFFNLIFNG